MTEYPALGTPFPAFSLSDEKGETLTNAELKGKPAVLYFYPKDDTPGCTTQACSLRDRMPEFAGARVIGVSPDSARSHAKFAAKFGLPFTLLADEDHRLAEACGVWVEKSLYGKTYMGVERTTFVLDGEGVVRAVFPKVKPAEHADLVRRALEEL